MNAGGATFPLPSRTAAAWFEIRATRHRLRRFLGDLANPALARIPRGEALAHAPILAEHRSPLWQDGRPDEFPLVAGKAENLRLAIRGFAGIEVPPGKTLSFWKQVGPPWKIRGFVEGREINQGCVIPAIAGGLCQLSNTLALAAERAGIELAERHAHTARIEQALPEIGDATVFWNHVDLRLTAPFGFRVEAELTASELVVRIRGWVEARTTNIPNPVRPELVEGQLFSSKEKDDRWDFGPPSGSTSSGRTEESEKLGLSDFLPPPIARGCLTCGESACYRHGKFTHLAAGARTAALLNAHTPEFAAYLAREFPRAERLTPWLRRGSPWGAATGVRTIAAGLARTALLRFNPSGGARQQAVMRADRLLAAACAARLAPAHVELVIDQSLLVPLAERGLLGGRRYTVLVHSLPASEIERRLDEAAARHPHAASLRDFRVGAAYAEREWQALRGAAKIVTPHVLAAKVLREAGMGQVELLDWEMPPPPSSSPRKRGPSLELDRAEAQRTQIRDEAEQSASALSAPLREKVPVIGFPASALPRKGAIEVAEAARRLGWKVRIGGALFPDEVDWSGVEVEQLPLSDPDWLAGVDAVALPAWVEHSPRMLLKALAAGVPVVASEACGLDNAQYCEVTAGDTGTLAAALAFPVTGRSSIPDQ